MRRLAEQLFTTIRKQELLRAGDRLAVAVSGGADSVALLGLLAELRSELGIVLSVVHVNHKLRGAESDEDEHFVEKLASDLGLEVRTRNARIEGSRGSGIESAARRLRYEFFRELARTGFATKIATAHTLDDQAETVLLRIFRGTGIRGLGGIHPRLRLGSAGSSCGEVVRPLLGIRRAQLREYLRARGQTWREDSSNQDVAFLRNRVRRRLLPLITEEFGVSAIEHMAELAEIARAEEELWSNKSGQWKVGKPDPLHGTQPVAPESGQSLHERLGDGNLNVARLLTLPLAIQRREVRAWIEVNAPQASISFRLIEEILELAHGPAGKKLELANAAGDEADANQNEADQTAAHQTSANQTSPDQVRPSQTCPKFIRRDRHELVIEMGAIADALDYEYTLPVPGEVAIPVLGTRIEALFVDANGIPEQDQQALLDPSHLPAHLLVRNWRAGDRFWPAHTRQEKKVKELLTDRHLSGPEKKLWPVAATSDGRLVWIRGFAAPASLQARAGKAVWIREIQTNPNP